MKQSVTTIITENATKLEAKLDATIIEYDAYLNVKTEDIKQDIKTVFFLELQQQQSRIEEELSEELIKTKDRLLIEIIAGVNILIISEVEDLRQEFLDELKSSTSPPHQQKAEITKRTQTF